MKISPNLQTGEIIAQWKFIKANRQKGIGAKNGNPYDFANITVSDGDESFEVACFPPLATMILEGVIGLSKRDIFQATLELETSHRGLDWVIKDIQKVEVKELVKN